MNKCGIETAPTILGCIRCFWQHPNGAAIKDTPQTIAVKPSALDPSGYSGLSWPGPLTAYIAAIDTSSVAPDMIAAVLNGQSTPEEAVKIAYEKSVQIFKEFGAPGEK
jgi:hypothetical protein